jgi:hypothetical protein
MGSFGLARRSLPLAPEGHRGAKHGGWSVIVELGGWVQPARL